LKIAKDKFVILLGDNKFRINTFVKYLIDNPKSIQDCLFHENSGIISTHCELIYEAFNKAYLLNPNNVMRYLNRKDDVPEGIDELSINSAKLFEHLLLFFPKINNKLTNRTYPLLCVSLIKFY
jgi:hypothetical protein